MALKKRNLRGLTAKILSQVKDEDLRYTVLQYARNHRDFRDFLHLHFLHLLPDENPKKKYANFLSGFLRKYLDRPDKITNRSTKQILNALEELRQQARDLISTRNYLESYAIFINLLLYNSLLIERTAPNSPTELTDFQEMLVSSFAEMLEMELPRPLLNEIEAELKSMLLTGSIYPLHPTLNPLALLLMRADSNSRRKALLNEYIDYLESHPPEPGILRASWAAMLHQSLLYKNKATTFLLLEREVLKGKEIYRLAFDFLNEDKISEMDLLVDCALKHYGPKLEHYFLEPKLIRYIKSGDDKRAVTTMQCILNSPYSDHVSLKKLLRNIDPAEKKLFAGMTGDFVNQKDFSTNRLKVIAVFLSWLEKEDDLFEMIKEHGDVWAMIEFNSFLGDKKKKELFEYYRKYLIQYLDNHIGRMSIEHTRKVLSHIRGSGMYQLADKLEDEMKSEFSHRKSFARRGR